VQAIAMLQVLHLWKGHLQHRHPILATLGRAKALARRKPAARFERMLLQLVLALTMTAKTTTKVVWAMTAQGDSVQLQLLRLMNGGQRRARRGRRALGWRILEKYEEQRGRKGPHGEPTTNYSNECEEK